MKHEEMKLDPEREVSRISEFIRSELRMSGLSNIVVGLSGGVDSALTVCLCARAVGSTHVFSFLLPYRTSGPETRVHGRAVAEVAGISCEEIEITPAVDALHAMLSTEDRIRRGNVMARVRMIVLYDRSAAHKALVAGTGNRTEALLGYTTLHGDSACGFAPIAHLYKCQVRQLAAHLGVREFFPGHLLDGGVARAFAGVLRAGDCNGQRKQRGQCREEELGSSRGVNCRAHSLSRQRL